ncbi:MAG: DegT/DnrJ/EryC1/StrS family aminotransferase [Bacteroidales bacterium]|nr:DegT/DnrJ/EryC1/StrS family aminotransferase [Bacteroidales bacterium]
MNEIKMVDLEGQYHKISTEIDKAIKDIIHTSTFINGEPVRKLQDKLAAYVGVKHAIACANCTDALTLSLMALGLKPGDEVITTNFTFIATVEAIALLRLTPVIVDVDPHTFTIDITEIENHITPRTKAIMPVHLFGQGARISEIMEIAKEYNLYVIEDNAQSLGADYRMKRGQKKKLGSFGHISCTSFFPSKNLGCFGDGGAMFTDDDELAEKLTMLANHGSYQKYFHEEIGINSRLDTIQAAVLLEKLKYLDEYNCTRAACAEYYDSKLRDIDWIEIPFRNPESTHVFNQYTLKFKNGISNAKVQNYLKSKNIPSMIYYPLPMHMQKAFKPYVSATKKYPVSEELMMQVLSLPMHTELTKDQMDAVVDALLSYTE